MDSDGGDAQDLMDMFDFDDDMWEVEWDTTYYLKLYLVGKGR